MVDGSLVYHRGFGERRTAVSDSQAGAGNEPAGIHRRGPGRGQPDISPDRTVPPHGRPAPLRDDPAYRRQYLARRGYWASYFPDRTLIAETGSTIRVRVRNNLAGPHEIRFHRAGPGGATSAPVLSLQEDRPPGVSCAAAGNLPVHRPRQRARGKNPGPVRRAGGDRPRNAWRLAPGGAEFERQWLWLCHDVDSDWARIASRGQTVNPITTPAVPRYFTLNGCAGYPVAGGHHR